MMKSLWAAVVLLAGSVVFADDGGCPVAQNIRGHENVEWSISYAFHLTDANKDLPRVLLVGDSICNGYQERVRELTEGRCNVSYWISSYCATSPEYLRLLAFHLDVAKYDVIHFNNGLHSLDTDTASWAKALAAAFRLIREKQPQAKIVWATSTPLDDDARTAKARELNAAAEPVVRSFGDIETNDLFALLDPLDRKTYWSDVYHHKTAAKDLEARQVARFVLPELRAAGVTVNGASVTDYERRTFADGEAIRYRLPKGERRVTGEATEWTLPEDARIWYQDSWEGGVYYEAPYTNTTVGALAIGRRMAFPVTAKLSDGSYRLFTEANVVDYTDGCAVYLGKGRFGVDYYADTNGFDQVGAVTTPWRVMLKANDLQTLATSDIVRRLCPAPTAEVAAKCASFVRPGRAVWQWLPAGDPVYGEQKDWYDRTKALGFEYYLIDDGWKRWRDGEMDQWACLKKWIDYGKSIGVESFMWVDSKEMLTPGARRAYLRKVKASGAVGIKIDFIPKPSYGQMKWYEETLAETLELGLMTDFHGCVKPSGREKTWPHEVAREAIRGHEWHITRYKRALPPEHDCILPFNRLVQGHADYTPMVFEKKELNGYTWVRELAQGIVYSAPFLCCGDYPKNYLENPAAELIRALPSVYDETRILPGSEIGECVAVAKRKGEDWFVAVENGSDARNLDIVLDFLPPGEYDIRSFADAKDRPDGYEVSDGMTFRGERIPLALRPCGGFAAWLRRGRDGRGSGTNDTWTVAVQAANPLFDGWYADPQIRRFGERYWIYPTCSTNFTEQTQFDCFSSDDLKAWTRYERILSTNEIGWARGCLWAPDAQEKDGKYYLFFSANNAYPVGGRQVDAEPQAEPGLAKYGGIGVAVADRPEGPYRDLLGKPLIDRFWNGAQPIDQYVFCYKGDWYMVYGGWHKCNLVRLSFDFRSLVPFDDGRLWRPFTPEGYAEGSVLFERKGTWYFMYSFGSWEDETYGVRYSTADTPFGPFSYRGCVLSSQRPLATGAGHHSVICVPGTDDWYICYHRRPIPNASPHHRVTCLDRIFFNADGTINPVVMTAGRWRSEECKKK